MFKILILALVVAVGSLVSWQLEAHVHSTRWSVKTLADGFEPDTSVVASSVSQQCRMKGVRTDEAMVRQTPERTVYCVEGDLIEFKKEVDNDYHLVIEDPKTHERLIAEIPDGSATPPKYASKFQRARRAIDTAIGEPSFFATTLDPPRHVTVTGIGFFDEPHFIPQSGMSKNCRELHPVFDISIH